MDPEEGQMIEGEELMDENAELPENLKYEEVTNFLIS